MIVPRVFADTLAGLRAGLGVEDIAVRGKHDVAEVRRIVANLRSTGTLTDLTRQGSGVVG